MELFAYLLKVSGCMAVCYVVYYLLYRKLTFYTLNRYYLLLVICLCSIIPLLHIEVVKQLALDQLPNAQLTIRDKADHDLSQLTSFTNTGFNWLLASQYLYWIVTFFMLSKVLYTVCLLSYRGLKKGQRKEKYRIVYNTSAPNASFFNIIFINDKNNSDLENEQVLTHEKVHAHLWHSIDNLLVAILRAFLWFNPFIYLIANALQQTHEFEVDCYLANKYNAKVYATLLLKLAMPSTSSLVNTFSAYSLKARIQMLFKPKSKSSRKLCYLLFVPLIGVLVYSFAVEEVYGKAVGAKQLIVVIDAGHGGTEKGAMPASGYVEKDLNLALALEIQAQANKRGIKTILTRTGDINLGLKNRVEIKGDIFISIHVNSFGDDLSQKEAKGIDIALSNRNAQLGKSRQLAALLKRSLKQLDGIQTNDSIGNKNAYVLTRNNKPAVLIEFGYITNPNDLNYILDKHNQVAMARKVLDAITNYSSSAQ